MLKKDGYANVPIDIILNFFRSKEDMKNLVGYPAFKKALEEYNDIEEACKISGLNINSVIKSDKQELLKIGTITVTRKQAIQLMK